MFTLDDLAAYHIPMRYLYSAALHGDGSMLWTPSVYAGYYLFGEGQIGMAHPWHLLLYRFLPLVVAFNVELISSYVVMFAGVVLLLKRLGLARESRWFGAMVFTFSSYNLFHLIHPNIVAVVAHIPWLLVAAHALTVANDWQARARAFVALTLLFASQMLAGHPQHVWFGLIAIGCMCVYFLWSNVPIGRVGLVAIAFAVGGLIAGVQLLPLLDAVASSSRAGWSRAESLSFSLHPLDVVQLWSPSVFNRGPSGISIERSWIHEFIVYNGAFCTVALAWVAARWSDLRNKWITGALLLLAAIALLLAFGQYGGLYTSLLALPGLRWFRAPSRHLVLFDLSLSVVAAIVFDDLAGLISRKQQIAVRRLWPLTIPCGLSVGTAFAAAILSARGYPLHGLVHSAPWIALFITVTLLFVAVARGKRWALPLLVVVTACDQGYFGFHYVFGDPSRPMMTAAELAMLATPPESAQPGDLIDARRGFRFENALIPRGFRVWPGYVGLSPVLRLPDTDTAAQLAGAKWRRTEAGFEPIQRAIDRARLLTKATVTTDVAADVAAVDVLDEALVDQPIQELSGLPGSARLLEDVPGRIVVETTAPGRQLLALTERFDAGWQVTDAVQPGEDAAATSGGPPLRIYGDFLGYVVGPGTHQVTFRFSPRSFRYGLLATAFGLLLILCVVPFAFRATG